MFVNGEEINLYNFKYKDHEEYYDIKGKSITKSLMKTPINGARLSSSFGMRKHPILGYNKMHRGTDFAAQVELQSWLRDQELLQEQDGVVVVVIVLR